MDSIRDKFQQVFAEQIFEQTAFGSRFLELSQTKGILA